MKCTIYFLKRVIDVFLKVKWIISKMQKLSSVSGHKCKTTVAAGSIPAGGFSCFGVFSQSKYTNPHIFMPKIFAFFIFVSNSQKTQKNKFFNKNCFPSTKNKKTILQIII